MQAERIVDYATKQTEKGTEGMKLGEERRKRLVGRVFSISEGREKLRPKYEPGDYQDVGE